MSAECFIRMSLSHDMLKKVLLHTEQLLAFNNMKPLTFNEHFKMIKESDNNNCQDLDNDKSDHTLKLNCYTNGVIEKRLLKANWKLQS